MNLKQIHLYIILLLILSALLGLSKSSNDKNLQITIDGISSDFDMESDQILLSPNLSGMYFESDQDSRWGSQNEISKINVTWDTQCLYIAVDGICNGNNIIVYIDSKSSGVSSVKELSSWKRNFLFDGMSPDFFLIAQDNNTSPEFWKILSEDNDENFSSDIVAYSTFHGSIAGSLEAKIPWHTLFSVTNGIITTNAKLKIVAVVSGGDYCSGPDSAPDSSIFMPLDCQKDISLDNFLIISIDQDKDGLIDINANIRNQTRVNIDITSLKYQPLLIDNLNTLHKSFSPNNDGINDETMITFRISKDAEISAKVFDFYTGRLVSIIQKSIKATSGYQQIQWNGYNDNGLKQSAGLYIIVIKATSSGVSISKKELVYLIE